MTEYLVKLVMQVCMYYVYMYAVMKERQAVI